MENTLKNGKQPSILQEKTLNFAIKIVEMCRFLTDEKKEYVLSKQLLRSGTNPGAMVRESANAESGIDFIHKLAIAQKEVGETQYWLELLRKTNYILESDYTTMYNDAEEIMRIIRSSILTRKQNLKK